MPVARPDAPGKLAALRRLADNEPGAQAMSIGDSNHLLRHGLVEVDRTAAGRRHTITAAGWALLGEHAGPGSWPRSANPPRSGHGVAVGDVVAYADGRTQSGAWRTRRALVAGFGSDAAAEDGADVHAQSCAGEFVLLDVPGQAAPERRPLSAVMRVDPPVTPYREDLGTAPAG